jgi:hypothetical protein
MPHKKALRPLNLRERSMDSHGSPVYDTDRIKREVHILSKTVVKKDKEIVMLKEKNESWASSLYKKDVEMETLKKENLKLKE